MANKAIGIYEKGFAFILELLWTIKSELASSYISDSLRELIAPAIKYISENYTHLHIGEVEEVIKSS